MMRIAFLKTILSIAMASKDIVLLQNAQRYSGSSFFVVHMLKGSTTVIITIIT